MGGPKPYLPLWVDDWIGSGTVAAMTLAARGLFVELLLRQWRDGSLPVEERAMRRLAGIDPDEWAEAWPEVQAQFPIHEDEEGDRRRLNPRLLRVQEADREYRERQAEHARRGRRGTPEATPRVPSANPEPPIPIPIPTNTPRERASTKPAASGPAGASRRRPKAPKLDAQQEKTRKAFVDGWRRLWLEARDSDYAMQAKDHKAVRSILGLSKWDGSEALRRAENMLGGDDAWIAQHASLSLLASKWNELGVRVRRVTRRERENAELDQWARRKKG